VPHVFCTFKMYNTGWAESRRALDCFFTFMAEILGGYSQLLHRSGKKIILLSPLFTSKYNELRVCEDCSSFASGPSHLLTPCNNVSN